MGYTHYWKNEKAFTDEQWQEALNRGRDIISSAGVPLQWEYDEDRPVELSENCIRFNGVEDDGHETFFVSPGLDDFSFCKTAYKPYDLVVVAFLIMLNEVNPNFTWSSDGDTEDHEAGRELYEELKGLHLVLHDPET